MTPLLGKLEKGSGFQIQQIMPRLSIQKRNLTIHQSAESQSISESRPNPPQSFFIKDLQLLHLILVLKRPHVGRNVDNKYFIKYFKVFHIMT